MPAGNCPECRNLVALSATRCPQCGNRNFLIRTNSFLVICSSCDGVGGRYVVEDGEKTTKKECSKCKGKGYNSEFYTVDARNPKDVEYYFSEAKERKSYNDEIKKEALNEERLRDAKFAAEADYRIKKRIQDDKLKKEAKERLKKNTQENIGCTIGLAFTTWLLIGMGGCIYIHNKYNKPGDDAFLVYIKEATYAALAVLAIGILITIFTAIKGYKK